MLHDRRSQRTRKMLTEALYALISERDYDQITVQDIVDRADVARSSFYAHFQDKDDLMFSGFMRIDADGNGRLFDPLPEPGRHYPSFAHHLLSVIIAHRAVAGAFLSQAQPTIAALHLRNLLVTQIRAWLSERYLAATLTMDIEVATQYLCGALMSLLVWWVRHDFPVSADDLSARFDRLCLEGLQHLDES